MVWSRVEGHFLALLGVVGQEINFSILLGSGGKVTFSYCWELSVIFLILLEVRVEIHFSHVVTNWWKVKFFILLEVKAGREWKITFRMLGIKWKVPFLIIFRSGGWNLFFQRDAKERGEIPSQPPTI